MAPPAPEPDARAPAGRPAPPRFETLFGHRNMLQLIQLRWLAVLGQIITIAGVTLGLGIELPLPQMSGVLACLVAFNIASQLRWHEQPEVSSLEIFVALLVDVAALTAQLYLSGGVTNPFVFLYLLQVILGAVLLKSEWTWILVSVTGACFAALALLSPPLPLPLDHGHGLGSLYIQGMLISFALNAALLVIFITRINQNLRERDARLADLRQRAVEEEHIVRMGLLASGAAHELGTPLSTLSVILGDWRHMPEFSRNPVLLQEISEMQTQLQRCKSIVSGILLSAGETRGESSERTTLGGFIDELLTQWGRTRPTQGFSHDEAFDPELPVVSDSALHQTLCHLLDNALEASPQAQHLSTRVEDGWLRLSVSDQGPGFSEAMLAQFGKPYQSTKGRPGGGLGLFLASNVARTLGGSLSARNRSEGGAIVTLTLPLAAIKLEAEPG
ncbi:MAG: HAMP domain-containing histidine kinase [Curvibacter sp.]|nr:HAMP domain-containing histidine kinase [Curvibacter sp.]